MAKLNSTHEMVKTVLERQPETRSDDWLLILEIWKQYISTELPIETVLLHHIELGIPNFETIRRCRQKLQSKYPHLVDEKAKEIRKEEEKEFRKYALDIK